MKNCALLILIFIGMAGCKNEPVNKIVTHKSKIDTLKPLKRKAVSIKDSLPQLKEQTISNKLLYEVINTCLASKRVRQYNCRYIRSRQNYEMFGKGFSRQLLLNDSVFSKEDRIKDQKDLVWKYHYNFDEAYLPGYGVVNVDSLHKEYKSQQYINHIQEEYDGKFLTIHLPIFNKAQNYAMMAVGTTTFLSGAYDEGVIYILKKQPAGWEVVNENVDWWRGKSGKQ